MLEGKRFNPLRPSTMDVHEYQHRGKIRIDNKAISKWLTNVCHMKLTWCKIDDLFHIYFNAAVELH